MEFLFDQLDVRKMYTDNIDEMSYKCGIQWRSQKLSSTWAHLGPVAERGGGIFLIWLEFFELAETLL